MEEKDLNELVGFVLSLYISEKQIRQQLAERIVIAIQKLFTIKYKELQ